MKKRIVTFLILMVVALTPFLVTQVSAQGIKNAGQKLNPIANEAGLSDVDSLPVLVGTIINAVLSLLGMIFLVLTVYAGMLWMTARGDETQISKAKDILSGALIGLFITVSAYAITFFVTSRFEG